MVEVFTEASLKAWFRENVPQEFHACEADFISAMVQPSAGPGGNQEKKIGRSRDWLYDTYPAAQVTVGSHNIRLEELTLGLIKTALCGGLAELLIGNPVPVPTVVASLCWFAKDAGMYCSSLSAEEQSFYHFLVTNFYSYSDRLNELFYPPAGSGFSLREALDRYVAACLEKDLSADPAGLREAAEKAAQLLQKKDILCEKENGSWRISF